MQESCDFSSLLPRRHQDYSFQPGGVRFDADRMVLVGSYSDELSTARAKRVWKYALTEHFFLDKGSDYRLTSIPNPEKDLFVLECEFLTSAGRYALWRLINNQYPEAQYLIETAHVPEGDFEQKIKAPDLCSVEEPTIMSSDWASALRTPAESAELKTIKQLVMSWLSTMAMKKE
jgi:hypothetical protein